ncbi:hypothetical protein ACWDTG_20520 [Rhodococcus zopfii]
MAEDYSTSVPPQVEQGPTETPVKKPRRWPWIVGIVAALLGGVGIGIVGTPSDEEIQARIDTSVAAGVADQRAQLDADQQEAADALADAKQQHLLQLQPSSKQMLPMLQPIPAQPSSTSGKRR